MNGLKVVRTSKGILFSPKKEGHSDKCVNTDEPGGHLVKGNKPVTKTQLLDDSTCICYKEQSNS